MIQTYNPTGKSSFPGMAPCRGLTPLLCSGVKAQLSTLKMLLALKADPEDGNDGEASYRG